MINILFGKWFLENDTFTISLFNNSINEAKKLGGEGFLDELSLEYYEKEIKYRIKQFADRLKDKEKIKQIVHSSILEDLAKQKKITINVLIDDIHKAANKYNKDEDEIKYTSFLQNLHIHKMHPSGSDALATSLFQKIKSKTKPNYIYRSLKTVDKIIDNDKSELKNPPENPKIGDRHLAQGYTWKFMSDRTWIKIRKDTDEYEGTELLNMFNRSKLDRPMLKAILHYYDNNNTDGDGKYYFNEKDVIKDFEGSCKYIGRNQLKKDIGKNAMVKADPYKGDKTKIFERAKIKFPNPEIDSIYKDEETNTTWNWIYSNKTKGMGWKEILKQKPISHISLHGEDGDDLEVEGKEKEENPLDPESEYSSKEYDAEIKNRNDYKVTKPFGIENPQKKPTIDQKKPITDIVSGLESFKSYLETTTTLANDIPKSKTRYGYIKKDNTEKDNFSVYEFYRKIFIELTDDFISQIKGGKNSSDVQKTFPKWFANKEILLPSNAKKIALWSRFTKEKYNYELESYAYKNNFKIKDK